MISFEYTIKEKTGLHARPAGILVKRVKKMPCNVTISCGKRTADAKKLFAIMGMAVKCCETVTVTIEGNSENVFKDELYKFFCENF